jgi:membrane protein
MKFFRLVKLAIWRGFCHDAFGVAKGAAYSSILSIFPALMLIAAIVATSTGSSRVGREITHAIGSIFPPGAAELGQAYFLKSQERPISFLVTTSIVTLWTASGVILSWMEGFRNAYQIPKGWGVIKERLIALGLVLMAGIPLIFATTLVAFGSLIEAWVAWHTEHELGLLILLFWTLLRWAIGLLTSTAVMLLIYHFAVPRTMPWHKVLPGAALATGVWFPVTLGFGYYVSRFAVYSMVYGSLATAIVLLVWLYIFSCIVLIGAEFNALLHPRSACRKNAEAAAPLTGSNISAG